MSKNSIESLKLEPTIDNETINKKLFSIINLDLNDFFISYIKDKFHNELNDYILIINEVES